MLPLRKTHHRDDEPALPQKDGKASIGCRRGGDRSPRLWSCGHAMPFELKIIGCERLPVSVLRSRSGSAAPSPHRERAA